MRRRLSQIMLIVGLFCVSMFLLAGPVMATESSETEMSEEESSEEMSEDGDHEMDEDDSHAAAEESQFMGTTTALIAGVLLGAVFFAMSNPGDIERVSGNDHH